MSYGEESMSRSEVNKTRDVFRATTTVADVPIWRESAAVQMGMDNRTSGYMQRKKDDIMKNLASDRLEDSLDRYVSNEEIIGRTSWLNEVHVPQKTEVDAEMDKAGELVDKAALSQSQRTKRGRKFKEKAERQAIAIREINLHETGRAIAAEAMYNWNLPENAERITRKDVEEDINNKEYLKGRIGSIDMIDDIAFYSQWRDYALTSTGKKSDAAKFFNKALKREKTSGNPEQSFQQRCRNITDPEHFQEEYINMLLDLEKLDLDVFNYSSDTEFLKNFSCKMATLKAFSHGMRMREMVGEDPRIKPIYNKLFIKSAIIDHIIDDYTIRIQMIRSPYYVLLASKDIDKFTDDELDERIKIARSRRHVDHVAVEYLEAMLMKRKKIKQVVWTEKSFGKGIKASDIESNELKVDRKLTVLNAAKEKKKEESDKEEQRKSAKKEKEEAELEKNKKLLEEYQRLRKEASKENPRLSKEEKKKLEKLKEKLTDFVFDQIQQDEKEQENEAKEYFKKLTKSELEYRKKRQEAEDEKLHEELHEEYEEAKAVINKFMDDLNEDYAYIKKNNKKLEESDVIALALKRKADRNTLEWERDRILRTNLPNRQIGNLTFDYTEYLTGCTKEEKEAIMWLNRMLSFNGKNLSGCLNEKVPSLNAKLELYYDRLILLSRERERINGAVDSEFDRDQLFRDYSGNKNFTKKELAQQNAIKEGINTFKERILKSQEHMELCAKIKKDVIEICGDLMQAYIKDMNMSEEDAKEKIGKARHFVNVREGLGFEDAFNKARGSYDLSIPQKYQEADVEDTYRYLFGKKMDKKEAKIISVLYEANRDHAYSRMNVMKRYYNNRKKEASECADIVGIDKLYDEMACLPFLKKGERKEFMKSAAAVKNKKYSDMDEKDAAIVRNALGGIFIDLQQYNFEQLQFATDNEMFENYDNIKKYADLGSVLMNLMETYNDAGGFLSSEERYELTVISHTLCSLSDCIEARSGLAVNADTAILGLDKLEEIPYERLKKILAEQAEIIGANDLKITAIERDVITLKEKKRVAESKEDKVEADILKIDKEIKKKEIELESIEGKNADAARHKDLAEKLILVRNMENKANTIEIGERSYITAGTSIKSAMEHNRLFYARDKREDDWIDMMNSYLLEKEAIHKKVWEGSDEKKDAGGVPCGIEKLYRLGTGSCILGEALLEGKHFESEDMERTNEIMSGAMRGLLIQFKEVEKEVEVLEGKTVVKYSFKQFYPLIMSKGDLKMVGKSLALYETVLTLAHDFNNALNSSYTVRDEVMKKMNEDDIALYKEIVEFSEKMLPMFTDMDKLIDENTSLEEDKQIRSAIEAYLQTFYVSEKMNAGVSARRWTMPSISDGYSEFVLTVKSAEKMDKLKKNYYEALGKKKAGV